MLDLVHSFLPLLGSYNVCYSYSEVVCSSGRAFQVQPEALLSLTHGLKGGQGGPRASPSQLLLTPFSAQHCAKLALNRCTGKIALRLLYTAMPVLIAYQCNEQIGILPFVAVRPKAFSGHFKV